MNIGTVEKDLLESVCHTERWSVSVSHVRTERMSFGSHLDTSIDKKALLVFDKEQTGKTSLQLSLCVNTELYHFIVC